MDNQTLQTKQQTLTLDFCQNSYKSILAKQYDNQTRYIPIRCTNCGQDFPLNQELTAEIKILTPDGRPIFDLIQIQDDGTLLLELTENMLARPGKADAEIRIRDGEKMLSTMTFQIMIEPSVYEDDRIIASEEYNALKDLIKEATENYDYVIQEAQKSADAASNSAKMSESYAVGGTDTRQGEDTDNAKYYSEQASGSAGFAETYMHNAESHMNNAKFSQEAASASAGTASQKADAANRKASEAQSYAESSQSYAIGGTGKRPDENISNAKYYYEQSKHISESFSGALRPMGTVTFATLPPLSTATEGDMYNVSDQFTTDASFKEGTGNVIPAGANVYKTSDGYWDVLAGTPVTGVKGNAENTYRRGNVNLTAENIGALSLPLHLTNSLPLDDCKNPGFYYGVGGNKVIGKPQGVDSFGLLVTREGNLNRGQFLFSSRKGIGIYIRRWDSDSNVWTEWVQVIDSGGNAVSATKVMQLVTDNVLARPVLFSDTNENTSGVSSVCKDLNFHYVPLNGVLEVPYLYSNTRDSTVSYTSNDNTNPTAWTNISAITSGEKHSSLFNKISTMFKNVRYLYKMLGTTDISQLGDGTVTGALSSLNANSLKCKVVSASIAGIAVGAYKIIEFDMGLTATNTLIATVPYLQHSSYQQMETKLTSITANSVIFRVNNNSNIATTDGFLHVAILYK